MADEKRCTCRDKESDPMVYGNHACFVPADGGPSKRVDLLTASDVKRSWEGPQPGLDAWLEAMWRPVTERVRAVLDKPEEPTTTPPRWLNWFRG